MLRRITFFALFFFFAASFMTVTNAGNEKSSKNTEPKSEVKAEQNSGSIGSATTDETKEAATHLRSKVVPGDVTVKTSTAVTDKIGLLSSQRYGRLIDKILQLNTGERAAGLLRSSILPGEMQDKLQRRVDHRQGAGQEVDKSAGVDELGRTNSSFRGHVRPGEHIDKANVRNLESYIQAGQEIDKNPAILNENRRPGTMRTNITPGETLEKTRETSIKSSQHRGRETDKSQQYDAYNRPVGSLRSHIGGVNEKAPANGQITDELDDMPIFFSVTAINGIDADEDGYLELFDFEIDIDVPDGSSEEVGLHIYDDQGNDYGWYGPYTFTGDLTEDNLVLGAMTAELAGLVMEGIVIFSLDMEYPYGSATIVETYNLEVMMDADPTITPPEFWNIYIDNGVDNNFDGYYESWDFEIDVDVADGSSQEVYINVVDDEGWDYGAFGPFTFTGTLTEDNAFITGFFGNWFTGIPRDVMFTFSIEWNGTVSDIMDVFVPAGEEVVENIPYFWSVWETNGIDNDFDGFLESWDFTLDVDVPNGAIEDVGIHLYDDFGNDFGWYGPFTFEGGLTIDNATISGFFAEMYGLEFPAEVLFTFDLEYPYLSGTIVDTYVADVLVDDAVVVEDAPFFYSVYTTNTVDSNVDGFFEAWDFEFDVDVPNGGIAETYLNIVDDEGFDYGLYGPFTFEGSLTSDNAIISGFLAEWFMDIPRDVMFTFNLEFEGEYVDMFDLFVPAGPPSTSIPYFFSVNVINPFDFDENGFYEVWDFEIDVDVPNGEMAEVGFHIFDDYGNDYGWVGPFYFEGGLTSDNVIIEGASSEMVGLELPANVMFTFELEFPYMSGTWADDYMVTVPVDAGPAPMLPYFYGAYPVNGVDMNFDGYYEFWDFEIDVDVPEGGIAEVYISLMDDEENDWGMFGPFVFEGTLTSDNAFITGFDASWFTDLPRDVMFTFSLEFEGQFVDIYETYVPAGTYDGGVPYFFSVWDSNQIDADENGYYESWDFEIDVDVTNTGIVDVGFHLTDNYGNDYGWYGPFTFESTATFDNVLLSGMMDEMVGLEFPDDVAFNFGLEFPYATGSIIDNYEVIVPVDASPMENVPNFYSVYLSNPVDANMDGWYEEWGFEIDVDVPNGGIEEVTINIVDDEGFDYGWFGPYVFEGYLTSDNVFIETFFAEWYMDIPRDVYFTFTLEHGGNFVDIYEIYVPAGPPGQIATPFFYSVSTANETDFNENGFYESWDFEIDVDVPDGEMAEVFLHFSDMFGNDWGWYGPYTFEGSLTSDNVMLYGMNAEMFAFDMPMVVDFYFDLEHLGNNVDMYTVSVPIDGMGPQGAPYFYDTYMGMGIDQDGDFLYQGWDFEIDVDVPEGGIAEVWINIMDDEGYDYGDFGPFVFEGALVSDNVMIGTFLADWFSNLPRDVFFDLTLWFDGMPVDMMTTFVSAESSEDDGGAVSSIAGYVNYFDGYPIGGVNVWAGDYMTGTGPEGGYMMFVEDGMYDVSVEVPEEIPVYFGMNILDVVKVNRHLAFLEQFDDPYKMIAGDVNVDGVVNILDAVNMKEALAMIAPLPSGDFGFFDTHYGITWENWWMMPQTIGVTLPPSADMVDFTGVRYGDVNASLFDMITEPGLDEITGSLAISNEIGAPGEDVLVPIMYEGEFNIHGYQLAVSYDTEKLEFISFVRDGVIANEIDGVIHLVWTDVTEGVETGSSIGSLRFNVLADEGETTTIEISEQMLSDYEGSEVFVSTEAGEISAVTSGVRVNSSDVITDYKLHPAYPNPFNPATTVKFDVPEASKVSILVYNSLGRVVAELYNGKVTMGSYELTFDAQGLASGVYYVKMHSTKKQYVMPIQLVK